MKDYLNLIYLKTNEKILIKKFDIFYLCSHTFKHFIKCLKKYIKEVFTTGKKVFKGI